MGGRALPSEPLDELLQCGELLECDRDELDALPRGAAIRPRELAGGRVAAERGAAAAPAVRPGGSGQVVCVPPLPPLYEPYGTASVGLSLHDAYPLSPGLPSR